MSIIDTLTHWKTEGFSFTVNTAVNFVNIVSNGGSGILGITEIIRNFDWKDNVNLLSLGVFLPLGFEFWPNEDGGNIPIPHYVNLAWRRASDGAIENFIPGVYNLPRENYELSLGAFLKPTDTFGSKFQLVGNLPISGAVIQRVSMINTPAALNGKHFGVGFLAKVEHTLPMLT